MTKAKILTKEERLKRYIHEHPENSVVLHILKMMNKEATATELKKFIQENRREGLTYQEIGKLLGVTKQAVHQQHSRAAALLTSKRALRSSRAPKALKPSS